LTGGGETEKEEEEEANWEQKGRNAVKLVPKIHYNIIQFYRRTNSVSDNNEIRR